MNSTPSPVRRTRGVGRRVGTGRVRVHFENNADLGPVFEVTEARVAEAIARNPLLADLVDVTLGQDGATWARDMADAEALFGWRFSKDNMATVAPALRWVHAHGAGVEHLRPFDWLPPQAALTNSRGVHGDRANEYMLMALLMLNNRVPTMVGNFARRRWVQAFNTEIAGKTLLILGVGHLGGGAARFAKKVGLKVIGIRRTGKPAPHVDEMHTPDALHALLPRADFLLCSAPLTTTTTHLIGRAELDLLKPTAGIVNVGRADVIDYAALADKLRRDELSGAILDVTSPEPLPSDSELWQVPNLLITPHSSSDDAEWYCARSLDLFFANLVRFAAGKPLRNTVDRALEY
ncbi:D-2-hydroxyacid dehydrogenase [Zavarzinia sp. CC-PAN008]|uniref:D-2-hydroxyacid dehydrogenase n=1 Tax=Zavarzinia sp. CC-PAN008 TaxID=3243332 RepID=UPI003F747138